MWQRFVLVKSRNTVLTKTVLHRCPSSFQTTKSKLLCPVSC